MTAAKKVLRCSSTTRNRAVVRAALRRCPLNTYRDVRKLEWQHKVRSMPEKRLTALIALYRRK